MYIPNLPEGTSISDINEYARLRLKEDSIITAEAVALDEQCIFDAETINAMCEKELGIKLYLYGETYLDKKYKEVFRDDPRVVLVDVNLNKTSATLLYVADLEKPSLIEYSDFKEIKLLPTNIAFFLKRWESVNKKKHPMILGIPTKMMFNILVKEAINMKASDMTFNMCSITNKVITSYTYLKEEVKSRYVINNVEEFRTLLLVRKPTSTSVSSDPIFVDVDFEGITDYRGRLVLSTKHNGYIGTMRIVDNNTLESNLGDLNLTDSTISFVKNSIQTKEPGLRIFAGATASGKNTTILSILSSYDLEKEKIMTVELPVEHTVENIIQIQANTLEEYTAFIKSLTRHNPSIVYITEMSDDTAGSVLKTANTGKVVFTTIHSNGVAETLTRLQEVSGLSMDSLIIPLHSIVYQELVREGDMLVPKNRYVLFDEKLKMEILGKPLGEMYKIVKGRERGD